MSVPAALVLAAALARVESVGLVTVESRLAVRVRMTGSPGAVAVHREGRIARVSIADAELGPSLVARRRLSFAGSEALDPAVRAASPVRLDRFEVTASASLVSLRLYVPPEVPVDVRRDPQGLLVVFPPPPPPEPATSDTAELARRLFPTTPSEAEAPGSGSVAELYPRLFPAGVPETQPEATEAPAEVIEPDGLALGPLRLRAAVDARYVGADTFVEDQAQPTRDDYLEVQPRLAVLAPLGEGRFTLDYGPVFRAFASYRDINSSSHTLDAGLDLPIGARVTLRARDRFRSGVLDTRVVDPGGEYFFGLGHFRRNDVDGGASVRVGPRLSVELGGGAGAVRFQDDSTFFDYDVRSAFAGLGYEITPSLRAVAAYAYDAIPRPDERPEAESTAHSGRLTLTGDILPLLTGEASVGYRDQSTPYAGAGGTGYSGLTLAAALTRQLGRESTLAVYASRSTTPSAFEQNGFYVSSFLQGTLQLPLPVGLQLRCGLGYQWNDYRTVASAIGRPREDRLLGWEVGLRRPVGSNLFLSADYRREERRSNVDTFDTDANRFYFQLGWNLLGLPPR